MPIKFTYQEPAVRTHLVVLPVRGSHLAIRLIIRGAAARHGIIERIPWGDPAHAAALHLGRRCRNLRVAGPVHIMITGVCAENAPLLRWVLPALLLWIGALKAQSLHTRERTPPVSWALGRARARFQAVLKEVHADAQRRAREGGVLRSPSPRGAIAAEVGPHQLSSGHLED
jgi:hypothetical protein